MISCNTQRWTLHTCCSHMHVTGAPIIFNRKCMSLFKSPQDSSAHIDKTHALLTQNARTSSAVHSVPVTEEQSWASPRQCSDSKLSDLHRTRTHIHNYQNQAQAGSWVSWSLLEDICDTSTGATVLATMWLVDCITLLISHHVTQPLKDYLWQLHIRFLVIGFIHETGYDVIRYTTIAQNQY